MRIIRSIPAGQERQIVDSVNLDVMGVYHLSQLVQRMAGRRTKLRVIVRRIMGLPNSVWERFSAKLRLASSKVESSSSHPIRRKLMGIIVGSYNGFHDMRVEFYILNLSDHLIALRNQVWILRM
jgi:hypothetical protein